jgi:hypothetical protein
MNNQQLELSGLQKALELLISKKISLEMDAIIAYDSEKKFALQQIIKQIDIDIATYRKKIADLTPTASTSNNSTSPTISGGKKVFFSYSKHDKEMLQDLKKHLSLLVRQGKLQHWDDSKILAGEEWDDAIKRELAEADIILLLVSANFMATDYIWQVEIEMALERQKRKECSLVPIVIKPCDWTDAPFGRLNALPSKGVPVSTFENQDVAWLEVVRALKSIL